jgi:TIR domain
MREFLDWGLVKILGGKHKGKIGYYDDDDRTKGIVYFGSPTISPSYEIVAKRYLGKVYTPDLINRYHDITRDIRINKKSFEKKFELSMELHLIGEALSHRMYVSRFQALKQPERVFISHSSRDKEFARWLAIDLANEGFIPWLDEWDIKVGESITSKISEGLNNCSAIILILSKNSVNSRWVEVEWQAKFWDEIQLGRILLFPILLQNCTIPKLIQTKKYADFRDFKKNSIVYSNAIEDLKESMIQLIGKTSNEKIDNLSDFFRKALLYDVEISTLVSNTFVLDAED